MSNLLKHFWLVHGLEIGSAVFSKMLQPLMETVAVFYFSWSVSVIQESIETQGVVSLEDGSCG